MKDADHYQVVNRKLWDAKTAVHIESSFYNQKEFLSHLDSLNALDKKLLGAVDGKSLLHLQCHFGQDSFSLASMGAKVTGVDLSGEAINYAKALEKKLGLNVQFVECDVYDSVNHIDEHFDRVYTSYGTIGWLPDLTRWAEVINAFLKPGGEFVMIDFHPVVWMFDAEFNKIAFDYFNTAPIVLNEKGTYADRHADIELQEISWNHSLGELLSALINVGLTITHFEEYPYSSYACFPNVEKIDKEKYVFSHVDHQIPMMYSLKALKQ